MNENDKALRALIRARIKSSESSRQKHRPSGQDVRLNEADVRPESHSSGTGFHGAAGEASNRAVRSYLNVSSRVEVPETEGLKPPVVSGRTSNRIYSKFIFTPEMDKRILETRERTRDLAEEFGCSHSLVSHRRWVLRGKPPKKKQYPNVVSKYENKKPPIQEVKPSVVGLPFARPAWFKEDVVALATGVPPYAITGQSAKPRHGNSGVLS